MYYIQTQKNRRILFLMIIVFVCFNMTEAETLHYRVVRVSLSQNL